MSGLKVAVVCSSNMNRSMEAHAVLAKKGFAVESYGTGSQVKIPGPTKKKPNVYEFGEERESLVKKKKLKHAFPGTTYESIHSDLISKDRQLYTENGMLNMLERNRRIKPRPERFQEEARPLRFDVILTCEEKVYDLVLADFEAREEEGGSRTEQPVHVINVDIVSTNRYLPYGTTALLQS